MKKLYLLLVVLFVLNGCRTINEKELLGEFPECKNQICKKMYLSNYPDEEANDKKDYLLDINTSYNSIDNWSTLPAILSLGTLQLVGFPYFAEGSVDMEAILKTKEGTLIKTYKAKGPIKSNVAGLLYGYGIFDAATASKIESSGDALRSIYKQINEDKKVYAEAEKIRKREEEQAINELREIFNGHRFREIDIGWPTSITEIAASLDIGDIVYFPQGRSSGPYYKAGLFAGQNTYDGNLADYIVYTYVYDKVFLYGSNSYMEGQPIGGYYKFVGGYSYTTILGAGRTVPAFRAVYIPERLIKYIDKLGINEPKGVKTGRGQKFPQNARISG